MRNRKGACYLLGPLTDALSHLLDQAVRMQGQQDSVQDVSVHHGTGAVRVSLCLLDLVSWWKNLWKGSSR